MSAQPTDNIPTIAAVGLLAYASADIGHHALGHGAACLAGGGRIVSLSSIFVDCTVIGTAIDLSGPLANLLLGLCALVAVRALKRASAAAQLFCILVAAFNLLWFAMQLVFSTATGTDDWAWALHEFHVTGVLRAALIIIGVLAYLATVRITAAELLTYARPRARVSMIIWIVWLTAGALACATAALDQHTLVALLRHAAPQSLLNSIGLLFVPGLAAKRASSSGARPALDLAISWIVAALIVGAASILFLGPGIAVSV